MAHRCAICGQVQEGASGFVPLVAGDAIELLCRRCVESGALPDTVDQWQALRRRRELEAMGWMFGQEESPRALPVVDLAECPIDPDVSRLVSPEFALRHRLIPVSRLGNAIVVVMADPEDGRARAELRDRTGLEVHVAVAPEESVVRAIARHYGTPPRRPRAARSGRADDEIDVRPLLPDVRDDTVIDLAGMILSELLRASATEVHIERNEKRVQVLYRIDGLLTSAMDPPLHLGHRLVACFRLLAGVRVPRRPKVQEAELVLTTKRRRKVRLRVRFNPHPGGENVVVARETR